ncbi:MAG: quinolinate synthase NadA [Bacteroidales bacterium]|jgi:quinolinate synthase
MQKNDIIKEIEKLKKEKNAIILAHYYTLPEIQDISDYLGDSLGLSRKAGESDADIIVFCGVNFMAETASIISPDKKVLIPVTNAGCSLAEGITGEDLKIWKDNNPDGVVVTYVNTTADVKAYSDYCCTSSNALKVVESIPRDKKILFAPDANLGSYISAVTNRSMEIWDGACHVHNKIDTQMVLDKINEYPDADILIHPESLCSSDELVLNSPNCYLYSTSGILNHVKTSIKNTFIIATEEGLMYQLKKVAPDKKIIQISDSIVCEYMKETKLEDVLAALQKEQYEVKVNKEIRDKAIIPINRMLSIG